jgi:hypothetical protein
MYNWDPVKSFRNLKHLRLIHCFVAWMCEPWGPKSLKNRRMFDSESRKSLEFTLPLGLFALYGNSGSNLCENHLHGLKSMLREDTKFTQRGYFHEHRYSKVL